MPDGSTRPMKFDGVDSDVMIDRKISVVTTEKAKAPGTTLVRGIDTECPHRRVGSLNGRAGI